MAYRCGHPAERRRKPKAEKSLEPNRGDQGISAGGAGRALMKTIDWLETLRGGEEVEAFGRDEMPANAEQALF